MLLKKVLPIHIIVSLVLNLAISPAYGQGQTTLATEAKELDFNLKFASLVLKTGEKIDRQLAGKNLDEMDDPQIESIIRTHMNDFLQQVSKEGEISPEGQNFIRKYLSKLKGKELVDIIRSTQFGLEVYFKNHGVGIAVAMGIGQVVNYVLVYISYLIGKPQLIPIVQLLPFSWAFAVIPGTYQMIKARMKLTKVLGGKEQFLAYKLQMKKGLEKIKKQKNLIIPLRTIIGEGPSQVDALVIEKLNWSTQFLHHLGVNRDKLNYLTLKNFLKKQKVSDPYISLVMGVQNIDKNVKTALISSHLLHLENNDLILSFKSSFSNQFIKTKNIPSWDKLKNWTADILKLTDGENIRNKMFNIPADTPPEVIFEIWDEVLMPHLATMRKVKYSSFRTFKENLELIKAWSYQQNSPHWNLAHVERFDELLRKSLRLFPLECRHPEAQSVNFLLKHTN